MTKTAIASWIGALAIAAGIAQTAQGAPTVFNNEAAFLAAAGAVRIYGFETNSVTENVDLASPILAATLDNSFDIANTGLNAFSVTNNPGSPFAVDGSRFLFTHSSAAAAVYTLTFSNFDATNAAITAFGLTVVDFASNIQDPTAITFDAGALSGTLLSVPGGQPDFTQNFVGLVVDPGDAFTSITLSLNDIRSGFQSFDRVIYSQQAAIPEPGTLLIVAIGGLLLGWQRRAAAS